jgi:NADPH:quinone reductase-like Zn-dependent oxidoreductase
MKAAVIHAYGGPDVLKYEDYPYPQPGPSEALVRAASINPVERQGLTKDWRPAIFPGVLGWDPSGTIVALGDGARDLTIGEKVFAWGYHAYAELCVVKAELAKVPAGLDVVAGLPLVSATGCQLISVAGEPRAGQTVLVSGANGAVGRWRVFTAKDRGCVVIAGVRAKDVAVASRLGADQVAALDERDGDAGPPAGGSGRQLRAWPHRDKPACQGKAGRALCVRHRRARRGGRLPVAANEGVCLQTGRGNLPLRRERRVGQTPADPDC